MNKFIILALVACVALVPAVQSRATEKPKVPEKEQVSIDDEIIDRDRLEDVLNNLLPETTEADNAPEELKQYCYESRKNVLAFLKKKTNHAIADKFQKVLSRFDLSSLIEEINQVTAEHKPNIQKDMRNIVPAFIALGQRAFQSTYDQLSGNVEQTKHNIKNLKWSNSVESLCEAFRSLQRDVRLNFNNNYADKTTINRFEQVGCISTNRIALVNKVCTIHDVVAPHLGNK